MWPRMKWADLDNVSGDFHCYFSGKSNSTKRFSNILFPIVDSRSVHSVCQIVEKWAVTCTSEK